MKRILITDIGAGIGLARTQLFMKEADGTKRTCEMWMDINSNSQLPTLKRL